MTHSSRNPTGWVQSGPGPGLPWQSRAQGWGPGSLAERVYPTRPPRHPRANPLQESAAGSTSPSRRGQDTRLRARAREDPGRSGPRACIRGRQTRAGFVPRAGGRTASPRAPPGPGPAATRRIPAAAAPWQLRGGGGGGRAGGDFSLGPSPSPPTSGEKFQSTEKRPDLRGTQSCHGVKGSQRFEHKLAFHRAGAKANTGPAHLAALCTRRAESTSSAGEGGCPRAPPS